MKKDDVRESMKVLPEWLQQPLTHLAAKPYAGQHVVNFPIWLSVGSAFLSSLLGIAFGYLLVNQGGLSLLALPFSWVAIIHGYRKLRSTIMHACAHHSVSGKKSVDYFMGDAISIWLLCGAFNDYKVGHLKVHHSDKLLRETDEFYEYIVNDLQLPLGVSKDIVWRKFIAIMFSPVHHVKSFVGRIRRTFFSENVKFGVAAMAFWFAILAVVHMSGNWQGFVLAWLVPLTVLYEIASLLDSGVEHHWEMPEDSYENDRERLDYLTSAIFYGEQVPCIDANTSLFVKAGKWIYWALRMIGYHLPARLMFGTGDIPCHDYHHFNPGAGHWSDCISARENDYQTSNKHYTHTWGVLEAVDKLFYSMSFQSPDHRD
jgi:fatty acid desaturase